MMDVMIGAGIALFMVGLAVVVARKNLARRRRRGSGAGSGGRRAGAFGPVNDGWDDRNRNPMWDRDRRGDADDGGRGGSDPDGGGDGGGGGDD